MEDHYKCENCELVYCFDYANDNKICSGLVKNKNPDVPYDVIRLCINTTSEEEIMVSDFTPDEASSIITTLSNSLGEWMTGTKTYKNFRNIPERCIGVSTKSTTQLCGADLTPP